MAPRIRYPVPDLEEWIQPQYQVHMDRDPDETDWERPRRPREFETDLIRFEPAAQDDTSWYFQRVLGDGSFGLVGMWAKLDASGQATDKVAVKEMFMPTESLFRLSPNGRKIPEEIIIQTALQKKGCVPVLQLRGWNVLTAPEGHREKLRYYMEYCPLGDLDKILIRYADIREQDQDNDIEIPEQFLWQLLHNFAQVMVAMEEAPFDHPKNNDVGANPFILHLDVKLENIFLGDTDDADLVKGYPSCKIGDWGLAYLTSTSDMNNSIEFFRAGTDSWRPPEQVYRGKFGEDWTIDPPWRVDDDSNCHPYTTKHSVFAFASVIFRLMVLDRSYEFLDGLLESASHNEEGVIAANYEWIEAGDLDRNAYGWRINYSSRLKDLIISCLNINPAFRPTPQDIELFARTACEELAAYQFDAGINRYPQLTLGNNAANGAANNG